MFEIMEKKTNFKYKEKSIINFFKKNKYILIKKRKFFFFSLFSNLEAAEYLFELSV